MGHTSALGVSSVCMNIVRRDMRVGEARDALNVGRLELDTEWSDRVVRGTANLQVRFSGLIR